MAVSEGAIRKRGGNDALFYGNVLIFECAPRNLQELSVWTFFRPIFKQQVLGVKIRFIDTELGWF
jgi:hypothetical protein